MAKYIVIKNIIVGSGYIHDKNGNAIPIQSLVPKIGDIIEGQITEMYGQYGNQKGIKYEILSGQEKSLVLIPLHSIKEVDTKVKSMQTAIITTKTVLIILLLGIGVFWYLKHTKIIK